MKDFYKNTRECMDKYNEVMNVLNRIADRYERTSGKRLIKR